MAAINPEFVDLFNATNDEQLAEFGVTLSKNSSGGLIISPESDEIVRSTLLKMLGSNQAPTEEIDTSKSYHAQRALVEFQTALFEPELDIPGLITSTPWGASYIRAFKNRIPSDTHLQ